MTEVDLIPRDYRQLRWLKAFSQQMLVAGVAVLLGGTLLFGVLKYRVDALQSELEQLEKQRAVNERQRDELQSLDARRKSLDQQLSLLTSLRSGAPAKSMFVTIDQALTDAEVWFLDWEFRRAGVTVPESQAAGVETGYFIVVPDGAEVDTDEAWRVETHMKISGQARDHEALSRFVNGLYGQPTVVEVNVQRTELARLGTRDVVQFDLAVVMNSEARG